MLIFFTYFGTIVFAIAGALKARSSKMDIFGAFVLAFISSYGGGTIRDLFLNKPINWLNDYIALTLVFSSVILVYLLKNNIKYFNKLIFITDAIGIGIFTLIGLKISLSYNINYPYAIILGIITATFGGLVTDIVCNHIPDLLKNKELYATACLIGAILYIILIHLNLSDNWSMLISIVVIFLIRILSNKKYLNLPNI
jgi:uncharacterized membrane protein YeiH